MKNISPQESFSMCDNEALILDVRAEYLSAYKKFDVKNVIYIPHQLIEKEHHKLPQTKKIIIADSAGLRSKETYQVLEKLGYNNIFNMAGGIVEWERDQLPLLINNKQKLSGSCMCQLRPRNKK